MRLNRIDRITALEWGRTVEAVRTVTMTEALLATHFPRFPVLPGVLVADAMVQAAGWLVAVSHAFGRRPRLTAVRETKFRHYVRPGDQLVVQATVLRLAADEAIASASARVEGRLVATIREMAFACPPAPPGWTASARAEQAALGGVAGEPCEVTTGGGHGA